jgi:urate oxidase
MKTKHNILYLTYDGLKDPLGQSQVLPYLEGLAAKGFNITVISFEKSQSPNTKTATHQDRANSRLRFVELKYHKSPPVLSSLYDIYVLKKSGQKSTGNAAYRHHPLPELYHQPGRTVG